MPNLLLRLSLLLVFSLTLSVSGADASESESSRALARLKESVVFRTLKNGLRVIFYKRGVAPVFSGVLSVRVGGVDEKLGHTGTSHLLEHMAFKGTEELGTSDYQKEKSLLEKLDKLFDSGRIRIEELPEEKKKEAEKVYEELATLWQPDAFARTYREKGGVGLNATTDKDVTNYFISLPTSAFEFWAWMESERLLHPVLRQYYKERDVVMEERRLRYEDDPGGKLYEQLIGNAYQIHPYRHPVIGYKQDIQYLPITKVRDFLSSYYVPSNMALAIVGDIDPDKAFPIVEKYFGRLPTGERAPHPTIKELEPEGERSFVVEHPSSPQMTIAYRKFPYPHPDDPPLTVFYELFGGSRVTPLFKELVEKRKVATHFSYFEAPGVAYPNLLVFYGQPRSPITNKTLLKNFDQVLSQFKKAPITEESLGIAKRAIAMQFLTGLSSNSSLAKDFAESEAIYDNWAASIDWYEKMVAVTAEDIKRVMNKYLVPQKRVVGYLRQKKG